MNKNSYTKLALKCCVFVALVTINSGVWGQKSPLQRSISIEINSRRLDYTLDQIAFAGGFNFSYNSDCFPFDSIVSVRVTQIKVSEILEQLLPSHTQVREKDNYVIISCRKVRKQKKEEKVEVDGYVITGFVVDRYSGHTIPYASVYDKSNYSLALTNDRGYYSLDIPAGNPQVQLAIKKRDYLDTVIIVRPAGEAGDVNIRLTPLPLKMEPLPAGEIQASKQIEDIGLVTAFVPRKQLQNTRNNPERIKRTFNLTLIPSVSTNKLMTGATENKVCLNILIGYADGVSGLEVGGLLNIDKNHMKGLQIGGFGNIVGGKTEGLQIGGMFNFNLGKVSGIQLAGFSNVLCDTLRGISLSGIAGISKADISGIQLSGFGNVLTKNLDGIQMAGFANITVRTVNKIQMSGFANYAGAVKGIQAAGFANIAKGSVGGLQASGFLNYARTVNGYQVGIINICDTLKGYAFGLLSFSKTGFHKLEFTAGETFYTRADFRTGRKAFHNILSIGYRYSDDNYIAPGYGLGTEFNLGKRMFMNISLLAWSIMETDYAARKDALICLGIGLGDSRLKKAVIVGGIGMYANIQHRQDGQESYNRVASPYSIYSFTSPTEFYSFWIGGNIGVRLL